MAPQNGNSAAVADENPLIDDPSERRLKTKLHLKEEEHQLHNQLSEATELVGKANDKSQRVAKGQRSAESQVSRTQTKRANYHRTAAAQEERIAELRFDLARNTSQNQRREAGADRLSGLTKDRSSADNGHWRNAEAPNHSTYPAVQQEEVPRGPEVTNKLSIEAGAPFNVPHPNLVGQANEEAAGSITPAQDGGGHDSVHPEDTQTRKSGRKSNSAADQTAPSRGQ